MDSFKSILVVIRHEGDSSPALGHASALATCCGAKLTLAVALEQSPWYARLIPGAMPAAEAIAERARAKLEDAAARLRNEGLSVATAFLEGKPWLEAVRASIRDEPDLLLKDAGPEPGGLFTSEDMQIFRNAPCPVWIVNPREEGRPVRRVLAAVDPLPPPDAAEDELHLRAHEDRVALNDTILRLAGEVTRLESAELHVVHAWNAPGEEMLQGETLLSRQQVESYVAAIREAQQRALDDLLARHPGEVEPARVHFVKGEASDVLADASRELEADLIVMGTVVRTGLPGLLIGNTAETVLRRVSCSVLAVKPPGFVSPVKTE